MSNATTPSPRFILRTRPTSPVQQAVRYLTWSGAAARDPRRAAEFHSAEAAQARADELHHLHPRSTNCWYVEEVA